MLEMPLGIRSRSGFRKALPPVEDPGCGRSIERHEEREGIPRISSHGARHTSGSSYALAGASQKLIATMLGHSDTDATARYTHVQATAAAPLIEARWARLCGEERSRSL